MSKCRLRCLHPVDAYLHTTNATSHPLCPPSKRGGPDLFGVTLTAGCTLLTHHEDLPGHVAALLQRLAKISRLGVGKVARLGVGKVSSMGVGKVARLGAGKASSMGGLKCYQ